jgi:tetratricopeptide (TPR) repeat protein
MLQKIKSIPAVLLLFLTFLRFNAAHASNIQELYESAVDSYNQGNYDQSIELYRQINKDFPQFAPAYIGIGLSLKAKGAEQEEVLYYYKMAVEKDPSNVQALEQLGRLYYSLERFDKAQVVFENLIRIKPDHSEIKLSLAWIYLIGKKPNPSRSIVLFKDVLKKERLSNAYFGLGLAYFAENQREKALDVITQLRLMGADDYANRLEKSVRENLKVVTEHSYDDPMETSNSNDPDGFKTPDAPKGVKVRLSGKLDDL